MYKRQEISIPACASVMEKSEAICVSRPMGINSEVLKINAEADKPNSASQLLKGIFCSVIVLCNEC